MSPATTTHTTFNIKQVQRHHDYYIEGGDLLILVDNTFFRVHSYFLKRDSPKFRQELSSPEPGRQRKGAEESSAIQIRDATPDEFAKFLWVFYNEKYDQYRASVDEWTSILKISCNHDFPGVKDFAIRGLESCDIPIANRINLYRKYEVDLSYLLPLYVKLCIRTEGPTDEETNTMGTNVALCIFRARERLWTKASSPSAGRQPLSVSENDAFEAISSIFGYSAPIPATGPGSVASRTQKAPCMLTSILATPTGANGVVDKKKPKPNNDKNPGTGSGKSANHGPETKPVKA